MATDGEDDGKALELEPQEVALIIGEADGTVSVRVAAGSAADETAEEPPAAQELVLALAMRLLKDPDFHEEMLDWYYDHQDEIDGEEEE